MTSVVIIGAGPAGLAAARAARARQAAVTLLDSSDEVGGQYWRHLPAERPAERESLLHHGWSTFLELREALEADPGCDIVTSAQVWAIERDANDSPVVHVLVGEPDGTDRSQLILTPDALVLATGAHDRTLPFPGWQLPGVFSAGAAQALAKGERVAVGRRVVVAGAGPFLLPVAAALAQTGARVVGVFEASRVRGLMAGWLPQPHKLMGVAGKTGELAGYLLSHLHHRIPYRTGHAVVAAHGTDRVESVTVARVNADWSPIPGTERRIRADAVCVSHGFTPRLELAIAAGCNISADRFVTVDAAQRSTVPTVFAAGEITGIGGVDAALAEGTLAGHCAAGGSPTDPTVARHEKKRAVYVDFAARLERAHGIRRGWTAWLKNDTTICRCEDVSYETIRTTTEATCAVGLRSVKLTTRAGLGICQGRMCGRTLEDLAGRSAPGGLIDRVSTDRRPIAAPVRLGDLARAHDATAAIPTDSL
ncbi:NADPH-dependent 2,4-dienoyl-CoA reductase/sulfur reductase-like enzyme [Mycetocola sp. CAN_C7]|uniref:FAD-dependent oxidoreductase n=1 Tax=Mycetocola sp. CAN_C7 TaxID=2787724 RepID=UPI0018CAD6F2